MTPPPAEQFAARVFVGPTLRAQPDRRLVDLVRDGYDAAFEEIVRRYRRPLDRFAAAIVGGRSEDVTQDAFSKALLALRGSEAEIELRPWLYRIVRNTALNDLRDRAPVAEELQESVPGARSTAAEAEAREEIRDLMERLGALPEPQRAALVMRELEGLSHEEIAAALGVSGGAARQAIHRARTALREGFGLLIPMPVLRALADHADDAARAGGAIAAGAGASSAGGAALGAGALKVGMATVLIAGTVGAGVAIEHHRGGGPGPEAAEAAPLVRGSGAGNRQSATVGAEGGTSSRPGRGGGSGRDSRRGEDRSGESGGSLANEDRSGPDGGSSGSGGRSGPSDHSGEGGGSHSGSGDNSGPGSISGHGDDGSDDHSGPGSGSDDTGFDDHGDSSGPGSGDGGDHGDLSGESGGGGGGDSSGPGSGEVESEPVPPAPEPEIEDGGSSGSGGESPDSGSGESGGGGETGGLDGSP